MCVYNTLLEYIKRTKDRKSKHLFVSFKTLLPVSTSTIARWLKIVLTGAGIDVATFGAHSYRGVSTSAAMGAGVTLKEILLMANWSQLRLFIHSTIGKFSRRQIM